MTAIPQPSQEMRRLTPIAVATCIATAALLIACAPAPLGVEPAHVRLMLSRDSVSVAVDETFIIYSYGILPSTAGRLASAEWSIDDTTIVRSASHNETSIVAVGVKAGVTRIRARHDTLTQSVPVVVRAR